MKTIGLITAAAFFLPVFIFAQKLNNPLIRKFQSCDCSIPSRDQVVMGADGYIYSSECFAICAGTTVVHLDSSSHEEKRDVLTWYIRPVCDPTGKDFTIIQNNNDGTYIYKNNETGDHFRGWHNNCRCLAEGTLISTPGGDIPVEQITEGSDVWTYDESGNQVLTAIIMVNKTAVPEAYIICKIMLDDGRNISLSYLHPCRDYKPAGLLKPGDLYDGSRVISVGMVPYMQKYTYDILPAGETGLYRANGVVVGSTLFETGNINCLKK